MSSGGNVHVKRGTAAAGTRASVTAFIKSNFDLKWFLIAVEHERTALKARDRALAAPDGSAEMGDAFDDELRAAMVAIAAAAFAIDALHMTIDEMLDSDVRSTSQDARRPHRRDVQGGPRARQTRAHLADRDP